MPIQTLKSYMGSLSELVSHQAREEVITRYGMLFHPENLGSLTAEEFRSFLLYKNNQHWHGINRQAGVLTEDMDRLRAALSILLDESRPIVERLDELFPRNRPKFLKGLGRAVATPILLVVYPQKYGVYNSISEAGMRMVDLFPDLPYGASFAQEYAAVNNVLLDVAKRLDISLWELDGLWSIMVRHEDEPEQIDTIVVEEAENTFALERHLSDFLYRNWENTKLGTEYALYDEGGDVAQEYPTDIGRIDLLARNRTTGDFLVVELKRNRSSDAVVGQIMRYMAWVKKHLAAPDEKVFGAIIVQEVDESMRYSLMVAPSTIRLYTYRVEFFLNPVQIESL
ncbi:MAG: DUF1016 family protein [Chloroflexi bacterium]|nr:DUF1016 family protein [Chloroflexota bacterium]